MSKIGTWHNTFFAGNSTYIRTGAGYLARGIAWGAVAVIVCFSVTQGLALRRWVWDNTMPIRFVHDAKRQCYWALETTGPEGFLNQYEKMDIQTREWEPFLDYVPLRLLVMERWGVYLRRHFPEVNDQAPEDAWQPGYEFTAPLLKFNAFMDGVGAVSGFFLTWLWVRRAKGVVDQFTGVWQGIVAALLIWFNPAILISAYAWPTWDNWIVPMYLLAALLASLDWWFTAGIVLAMGAMLKGQQLAIAPVFILWPAVQGRFGAAGRWIAGLALGMGLIALPWALSYIPPGLLAAARSAQDFVTPTDYSPTLFAIKRVVDAGAIGWIAWILIVLVASRWLREWWWAAAILIVMAVAWPCLIPANRAYWPLGLPGGLILAVAALRIGLRHQKYVIAGAAGVSILASVMFFHGSHAWWDCGFEFGSSKWHWIADSLTDNLPGLMRERFGWSKNPDDVVWTLPAIHGRWPAFLDRWQWWPTADLDIDAKMIFNPIYGLMLTITGIAIGLQARWKTRRMLLALTLPWLVFFVFPVEIHGRYMLYPAVVSAICFGDSVGMGLISIALTAIATTQIVNDILQAGDVGTFGADLADKYPRVVGPDFASTVERVVQATHPDLAWAVLVITGIYLYLSLTRGRRGEVRVVEVREPRVETADVSA